MGDRQIAKAAARDLYLYKSGDSSKKLDEQLLLAAHRTDKFKCSDEEMLKLLNAEYRKVRGQSFGGYKKAINAKFNKKLQGVCDV